MQRLEVIYPDLINLSETTRSFHRAYRTEDEKLEDKRENADKLLNNMNSIYDKYVNGKRNVSIKFGEQPRSIATAIWVARAMLDDVRNKAKKPEFKNKQREFIEILESVQEIIAVCREEVVASHLYGYKERNFLDALKMRVFAVQDELFGSAQIEKGFAYYSKNY